jgi:hypothetical protein
VGLLLGIVGRNQGSEVSATCGTSSTGVEVRFLAGPLHKLLLRHTIDRSHFKNRVVVSFGQSLTWEFRSRPAKELHRSRPSALMLIVGPGQRPTSGVKIRLLLPWRLCSAAW